jgi:hypothetical protein
VTSPPSYLTTTLRPSTTIQLGSWTVVGAATAAAALAANVTTEYVQLTPRCRLDSQVLKLGFPALTLPANAQIFSVGVQVLVQTVVPPAPQPTCCGTFRCQRPQNILTTIIAAIFQFLFGPWYVPQAPTVTWMPQTLEYLTTDPSGNPWTIASFNSFEVDLARNDLNNNPLRYAELYVNVNYSLTGTVTVTAPTGTVTTLARPTVTWVYANPQSDVQQAFQVAIYSAAQVAGLGFIPFTTAPYDSSGGWVYSANQQWTGNYDVVNGTWWAYVQAQATWVGFGTFTTSAASTSWTQSVSGAPVATLNSATYDPVNNRVILSFQPSTSSPATTQFAVQVSRNLGGTWGPVRNYMLVPATGMTPVTAYDYEAPLNAVSQYRVLAYGTVVGVLTPSATYSTVLSVTAGPTSQFSLKDPINPVLNIIGLPIKYLGDTVTWRKSQAIYEVISGLPTAYKVAVTGPTYGIEGTFNLAMKEQDNTDFFTAFNTIEETGHTLLLQYPTGEQHYLVFGPGTVGSDKTYTWDLDPVTNKRRYTMMSVSYTEVAQPPITS